MVYAPSWAKPTMERKKGKIEIFYVVATGSSGRLSDVFAVDDGTAEGLGGVQAFDEGVNGADADIEFPKSVLQTGVRPAVYWGYAIGIGILIAGFRRVRILARG